MPNTGGKAGSDNNRMYWISFQSQNVLKLETKMRNNYTVWRISTGAIFSTSIVQGIHCL